MSSRSIQKGGTRGTVYRAAAHERLIDSGKLIAANRLPGAIYMAGYAIECHLKYAACRKGDAVYLAAELETHNWDHLATVCGVRPSLQANPQINALFQQLVEQWSTSLRYSPENRPASRDSTLYQKLITVYEFLRETIP